MEIKITIKGLDQLTESLALIGSALAYQRGMAPTAKAAVDLMSEVTDKKEEVQEEAIKEEKKVEEVTTDTIPKITIEQIREVFVNKNNIKGNTPKLKAILNDFGVKKVTDLEEKDFPAVLKELEER